MKDKDLVPDVYLDKDFDYKRLTKTELKKVLFENNINIRSNALKQELLDSYKINIYDKIDELKTVKQKELQKMSNIFQTDRSSIAEIDLNDKSNLLNSERVLRKQSASGKAIAHNSGILDDDDDTNISLSNEIKKSASFINTPSKSKINSFLSENELEDIKAKKPNKYSITNNATPIKKIVTKDKSESLIESKGPVIRKMESTLAKKIDFGSKMDNKTVKKNLSYNRVEQSKIEEAVDGKNQINLTKSRLEKSKNSVKIKNDVEKQSSLTKSRLEQSKNFTKINNDEEKQSNSTKSHSEQSKNFTKINNDEEKQSNSTKIRVDKKESQPPLSSKEQLKRLIAADMRKKNYDESSLIESSLSNYSGTSFSNVESYVSNKTDITEALGNIPKKKNNLYYIILMMILIITYGILKMLPYSNGNCFFCIKIPRHSRLVNGKIVCDKGFIYKSSLFKNSCIKDDTKEKSKRKIIRDIVSMLEFTHGDFIYGRSSTPKVLITELTKDEEIIQDLLHNTNVKIQDTLIMSVKYKVSLRTFLQFYSKKMIILLLPLLVLVFLISYYQSKRKIRRENEEEAKKLIKDILNVLLRQLIISTKNSRFPEYVYIDQLKDVFGENSNVWNIVQKKISNNSNVSTIKLDNKNAWQWIGPILRRKESLENMQI